MWVVWSGWVLSARSEGAQGSAGGEYKTALEQGVFRAEAAAPALPDGRLVAGWSGWPASVVEPVVRAADWRVGMCAAVVD
jgi:hypothetical protein